MLGTDGGNDADGGTDKSKQLFQLSAVIAPHLTQKDFMQRIELFANRTGDAHAIVIGMRCHQGVIGIFQQRIGDVLDARFSIAAADPDAKQLWTGIQPNAGILYIALLQDAFDRLYQTESDGQQHPSKHP